MASITITILFTETKTDKPNWQIKKIQVIKVFVDLKVKGGLYLFG